MASGHVALALLITIGAGSLATATASARHTHQGSIVDAPSGKVLQGIQVKAYAAQAPQPEGSCPVHLQLLDSRTTNKQGRFELVVDTVNAAYLAVYCSNGYAAREVSANDNTQDGTPVMPDPVIPYPSRARLKTLNVDPVSAAGQAIRRVLNRATDHLRYFWEADQAAFDEALQRLSKVDQAMVTDLLNRPATILREPPTRQLALERLVTGTARDLSYVRYAADESFEDALPGFDDMDRALIVRLETRPPVPVGQAPAAPTDLRIR